MDVRIFLKSMFASEKKQNHKVWQDGNQAKEIFSTSFCIRN